MKQLTKNQQMIKIKLSNYDIVRGFHHVIVKRNNQLATIQAFYLKMYENTFTPDGWIIGNRIA